MEMLWLLKSLSVIPHNSFLPRAPSPHVEPGDMAEAGQAERRSLVSLGFSLIKGSIKGSKGEFQTVLVFVGSDQAQALQRHPQSANDDP